MQYIHKLNFFQDSLSKLSNFENELYQLQNTLKKDVKTLREARKRRGLKSSSTDSGISDSYDAYEDLPDREQQLQRLKLMAKSLESNLHLTSMSKSISSTLDSTSRQLNHLKKIARISRKPTRIGDHRLSLISGQGKIYKADQLPSEKLTSQTSLTGGVITRSLPSRRRRIIKYSLLFNLILFGLFLLSWVFQPRCCDSFSLSSLSFLPQYSYVNGPPPT